ncbi:hypothetical protein KUCAC02_019278 [Chaenocephalus aceratus]|nr:hypothetical protein KUCAC02_019278 [Chaenocephalus aceratus]
MSLPAAARGFVVFLLVVQVVQGLDVWGVTFSSTEICAVKGSTVEIRCSFTYPSTWKDKANRVEKTFWFTKQEYGEPGDLTTDAEYAGRVEDRCGNNICTLRIRNLRESDSAEYRFRITTNQDVYASEPVTLSVTGLQVKVSNIYHYIGYIYATLECLSSCPPTSRPPYIWYKNGLKWTETRESLNDHFYPKESYACAVKGYENSPSPSVCVNGQDCDIVAYSEMKHLCLQRILSGHFLHVQHFEWRSDLPGTTLTVTALQVQVITATVQQSDTLAELKCQSSCSPAGGVSYVWFQERRGKSPQQRDLLIKAASPRRQDLMFNEISRCWINNCCYWGIIFLIAFLLIRRKRSSKPTTEAGERPDNDAQVRMYDRPSAEVQNATPESRRPRHKKDEKDMEDDVDHSTVTFKGHSATAESERHEAAEDPSALYSVVNKKPRVLT